MYYEAIQQFARSLRNLDAVLGKAEAYAKARNFDVNNFIQARLAPDMLPFSYQVKSTVAHSLGAIEAVRKGVFSPDMTPPPDTFAGLKSAVAETLTALAAVQASEVDAFMGRDMRFSFREHHIDFTAENFLLSFSQPNFYFHATTAYDILRWKGVQIGKRDFTGKLRAK